MRFLARMRQKVRVEGTFVRRSEVALYALVGLLIRMSSNVPVEVAFFRSSVNAVFVLTRVGLDAGE